MELSLEQKNEALDILSEEFKDKEDRSALVFNTPFEALVAVILSAQCTDERVNIVTSELFKEHNTPETMAELTEEELKSYIKSCGLANAKAKNILATSKKLIEEFNSEVPRTKEEIITLPGVGNKTANVVLANAYGVPGLGVDTHVSRVSQRIGLVSGTTPTKIEKELCSFIPEENWNKAHHWLLWHGRTYCNSRKPKCGECPVARQCQYYKELSTKESEDENIND